nr:nucleolin-like [Lytechinus pictus]
MAGRKSSTMSDEFPLNTPCLKRVPEDDESFEWPTQKRLCPDNNASAGPSSSLPENVLAVKAAVSQMERDLSSDPTPVTEAPRQNGWAPARSLSRQSSRRARMEPVRRALNYEEDEDGLITIPDDEEEDDDVFPVDAQLPVLHLQERELEDVAGRTEEELMRDLEEMAAGTQGELLADWEQIVAEEEERMEQETRMQEETRMEEIDEEGNPEMEEIDEEGNPEMEEIEEESNPEMEEEAEGILDSELNRLMERIEAVRIQRRDVAPVDEEMEEGEIQDSITEDRGQQIHKESLKVAVKALTDLMYETITEKCEGCINDYPGQLDHPQCMLMSWKEQVETFFPLALERLTNKVLLSKLHLVYKIHMMFDCELDVAILEATEFLEFDMKKGWVQDKVRDMVLRKL